MSTTPPSIRGRFPLLRWLRNARAPVIFGCALIFFFITHSRWFRERDTVKRWEGQAHDMRFRLRGPLSGDPRIAILGITASSFNQTMLEKDAAESDAIALMTEHTWPWPRSIHAKVIDRLFECGAKVVAVDVVFASNRPEDDALAAVLAKHRDRIVLASSLQDDGSGKQEYLRPNSHLTSALAADGVGYAKFAPDLDNVVRKFDFRTSELREHNLDDDSKDLINFAALSVAKFTGNEAPGDYDKLLDFRGLALTYAHLPVEEIFLKRTFEQGSRFEHGQAFQGKLVFYGPIAEILHDSHDTPFGNMPGVEIHAQLASSILAGSHLRHVSHTAAWIIGLVYALATALIVLLVHSALWQALSVVALGAAFALGTQFMFTHSRELVPAVPTLLGITATGLFGTMYLFLLEQWEKAHTRKVLNRFVSKRIAAVVLKNAEEFESARRGEKRPVAILFSDIRGFTTWSEKAAPEDLVGQLNEYFERMVNHIEEQEGNVQKFIGDAILAAWGDTHSNGFADDAARAVRTALTMRKSLRELNEGWKGLDGRIVLGIGMGINHGDVVVGEVGHPERREYTVLGDGVNFAARMESATKQFHTDCLVGETVEALTRDLFVYRHADFVRVKGKTKPVNIYMPLSDRGTPAPEWLADYHRARALYVARDFTAAAALFREVKTRIGEDFLCDQYADRCDLYAKEPPPQDWDGSYTLTEK